MGGAHLGLLYVQGCARSGTTLLKQLLGAGFRELELLRGELHLRAALAEARELDAGRIGVASRSYEASLEMDGLPERVGVVWLLRSPLDVLISKHPNKTDRGPGHFYVLPGRWVRSVELWRSWAPCPRVVTVRYEELVRQPEIVQKRIAGRFGLIVERQFAACHRHFDRRPENVKPMGRIRPLDPSRIDRARGDEELVRHLHTCFLENRALREAALEAGYDSFARVREWLADRPAGPPAWWQPAMAS